MCLDKVDPIPQVKVGVGYKVVRFENGKYRPADRVGSSLTYEIGKHITDDREEDVDWYSKRYPTGFHIFLSRKAAEWWMGLSIFRFRRLERIVKVRFTTVVASGLTSTRSKSYKTVIAREMVLLKEV